MDENKLIALLSYLVDLKIRLESSTNARADLELYHDELMWFISKLEEDLNPKITK